MKEAQIWNDLHTKWIAGTIVFEEEMDSTNIRAKELGEEGAADGTLVVTNRQTAGKGRRGRNWISPEGNCYFSLLLRPDMLAERASMITLVSALALVKAIQTEYHLEAMIKWPNDVVINGKKLCGILTESSTQLQHLKYVIVGIGINVNQKEFLEEIRQTATSISLETGKTEEGARLLAVFLQYFEQYYEIFLKTQDLSVLSKEYNRLLVNCKKEVKIIEQEKERILKAVGIDNMGGLIVEDRNGKQETIISGEGSVRGIYGYV